MCLEKTCKKCHETKPISEFQKCRDCKLGVRPECKSCKSKDSKIYREKNADKIKGKREKEKVVNKKSSEIKKKQKLDKLTNELVGLEFGSYKIVKFDVREARGKSVHPRNYFIKECKFCAEQWSVTPSQINKQKNKEPICILCSESVNVHTKEKKCNSCNTWKPATTEYFTASKGRRWGIHYYCIECQRKRNRKYRENPENRKKEYEYQKKRLEENSLYRFRCRISQNIKNAFLSKGFRKNSKSNQILGCSKNEFIKHIEGKFIKGMTWDNYGEWHLDHQVPISLSETEEEVIELCHHSNYQPLWGFDNMSKGTKIFIENISQENQIRFAKYIERYNEKL
jgi:hypothetical protein